jgi:hypothetical protein
MLWEGEGLHATEISHFKRLCAAKKFRREPRGWMRDTLALAAWHPPGLEHEASFLPFIPFVCVAPFLFPKTENYLWDKSTLT